MSYQKIHNLYDPRGQAILQETEVYALEKVNGTSARVYWDGHRVIFSSGGSDPREFRPLFDDGALAVAFQREFGTGKASVYGEAFGGTQQGQSWRYGHDLRFVAFEVQAAGGWRDVPTAARIVHDLGLKFVAWKRIPCTLAAIDAERDEPSLYSAASGHDLMPREGVVLRPLVERSIGNERVIAKHKRIEERETETYREVNPAEAVSYANAKAYATEWVTMERMRHVADEVVAARGDGVVLNAGDTRAVIDAMVVDVYAESNGEVPDTADVRREVSRAAAKRFQEWMRERISR